MGFLNNIFTKLNPAQESIVDIEGDMHSSSTYVYSHEKAFETLEVINRGVNLIVDSAAEYKIDVGDKIEGINKDLMRPKKLNTLLNLRPNDYINADLFKRNILIDLIIEGNAFIYFDGANLFNLPADGVTIISDKKTFINSFVYDNVKFSADEIIHVRDNSASSIFRGTSRLISCKETLTALRYMVSFQQNFFKNDAIPGLVLKTPNTLNKKVKDRILADWQQRFSIASKGARSPVILDGDFTIETLMQNQYKDLEFAEGVSNLEKKALTALGVPPVLLDSGNNANLSPNLKLFYHTTVTPLFNKYIAELERFFGYDLMAVTQHISALQPDLKDLSGYLTSLVNGGIMTQNEARVELRLPKHDSKEADELVRPANVAGSAANPSVGGKPPENGDDK